jgi:hypothetical protein
MKKTTRKVIIKKERDVYTYAEMWHTSSCLLKKGIDNREGSYHQFMASLVFTAFTLEAYLNHIGPKLFQCWTDLERLGPREKLNVISEHLGVKVSNGHRPWQIIKKLFGFRNDIAHGKSVVVQSEEVIPLDKHNDELFRELVKPDWENFCTEENAQKAREDVGKIIHLLYEAGKGKSKDDYPFIKGIQLRSAKLLNE